MAPLAPDPSAQLRTIRALRDEGFDVVHLHEPLAPGPVHDRARCSPTRRRSARSTPRARALGYRVMGWALRRMAARLDHRVRGVAGRRWPSPSAALGGDYELLFNGVEVERFAEGPAHPTTAPRSSSSAATSPARASRCCSTALADLPADVRVWVGGDGPQSEELRERFGHDRRIEWLGRISDDERAARMRGLHRVLLAVGAGRVLRHGAARGHGVGMRPGGLRPRGHRNVATDGVDALLAPVGDAAALAKALQRVLDDDGPCGQSWSRAAAAGPSSSRWPTWPSATSRSTSAASR